MVKRKKLYFHQKTGDICQATKSQAKKLNEDWREIQFDKNDDGTPRMRFNFDGATVDVLENGEKEMLVDGNGKSE